MKILVSDNDNSDLLYKDFIDFLYEVKMVQGPKALENTLFWHKAIKDFLIRHQKGTIADLEKRLKDINNSLQN